MKHAALLLLCLTLTACGGKAVKPVNVVAKVPAWSHVKKDSLWVSRYRQLIQVNKMQFSARFLMRSQGGNHRAHLDGLLDGDTLLLDIKGPLLLSGLGKVRLIINEKQDLYLLLTAKGQHKAASLTDLMAKSMRADFPIEPLTYWLKGIPYDTGIPDLAINDQGQATAFTEAGFKLAFSGYSVPLKGSETPLLLPRKITVENKVSTVKLVMSKIELIPE